MVTPRTHCHFTKQARALRVPELCDDHIPPSCLVTNSSVKLGLRSVVLPDPLLTQGGAVTFLACALHKLFVRSCDLARHGLYCSHVCARTHHSSLRLLLFGVCPRCFSVLTWMNLSACGCLLAPLSGITLTTRAIRSQHYSLSLSSTVTSWCDLPVSCANVGLHTRVTWCCDVKFLSCPQVTHGAISPQVQMGPTRTITSYLLSATLAEAATQLSFAAFLERCISVSASPPPPLPIPTPPLDAATQTFPHTAVSRDVSTQLSFKEFSLRSVHPHYPSGVLAPPSTHDVLCPTCSRPVPSLHLDAAVRTPLYSVETHDASTLTEFFIGCILSNDPLDRQDLPSAHCNAGSASPPQLADIATLATATSTLRPHMSYYSHHRVSRRMPVNTPHMVYLLKRTGATSSMYIHLSHAPTATSVPPKWEHILCAQLLPTREVQVPP